MTTTAGDATGTFFRRNGLSIVFGGLMALALVGHALTGHQVNNQDRLDHGWPEQTLGEYLGSGDYLSSLLENWESEFLQMGLFVLLTVGLRQRGASESRPFEHAQEQRKREHFTRDQWPWPVRRGGVWLRVYQNSLSLALLALFVMSFTGHFLSSWRLHADQQALHGEPITPMTDYLFAAQFWFESFQNWQSEFLAVLSLVLLSIVLRQKDSPESKQLDAPHSHTGH